jgi:beta-glucosidase
MKHTAQQNNSSGILFFPEHFMWGASTAGHQIEGNDVNSDLWLLENIKPTVFKEPALDACNSFELWETDLDMAKNIGLNTYRFSLEWSRIEPVCGSFSQVMIQHYKNIIDGCLKRNIKPVITFCHYTCPRWVAQQGGWTNPKTPELFARFCDVVSAQLCEHVDYVLTFNEPNILRTLDVLGIPDFVWNLQADMLIEAEKQCNCKKYSSMNATRKEDLDQMTELLIEGHKLGRAAIKTHYPNISVGFSLAVLDDQSYGENSICEQKRMQNYGAWLKTAEYADFIGVQNYERVVWDEKGLMPIPEQVQRNFLGAWVDPTSLANSAEYIHSVTGKPIIITEHGICVEDDSQRATFLTASLASLHDVMAKGVPILGYIHWSLMDNFEWIHGFGVHFGLYSVDRKTFVRTPKPSAEVYHDIIAKNAVCR